jgi:tetratricopeptide (TPR) repeat protein
MERREKTVFISWRRINVPWALAIFQSLTHHGYDVFFDYDGIASGDFESIILGNITSRAHFLILLTPSALERCNEPGDWLRREIETALDSKRNIVPLMLEGFSFGTPSIADQLTGKLAPIKKYNGLDIPASYFLEAMNRLRNKHLNLPLAAVTHPPSAPAQLAATEQRAAAEAAPPVQEQELTAQQYYERAIASTDPDEKIRFNTEAINLKPDFAAAYNNRAFALHIKGDREAALEDLNRAIQFGADKSAYNNRGNALHDKGEVDRALDDYSKAIRLSPDFADAYYNRGAAREGKGDLDGAINDFTDAIRLAPDDADAYIHRGKARKAKGDLDGALEDYRQAIRLKPDNPDGYAHRGIARGLKGDLEEALDDLNYAIRFQPGHPEAYYHRGALLQKKRKPSAALADLQQYLKLGGGAWYGNTEQIEQKIRDLKKKQKTKPRQGSRTQPKTLDRRGPKV